MNGGVSRKPRRCVRLLVRSTTFPSASPLPPPASLLPPGDPWSQALAPRFSALDSSDEKEHDGIIIAQCRNGPARMAIATVGAAEDRDPRYRSGPGEGGHISLRRGHTGEKCTPLLSV